MNYMKDVAKLLGVEIGEKFKVKLKNRPSAKFLDDMATCICYFSDNSLCEVRDDKIDEYAYVILCSLLNGSYVVEKLPKPILDDVEKRYLSRFIRPWRDEVNNIAKLECENGEREYILIIYKENYGTYRLRLMELPPFKKGTMYTGMEANKKYSLEELGL